MQPDDPSDDNLIQPLPQDGQTPFSPADPARDPDAEADDERQVDATLDDTHPSTDSGIEPEEVYDNGLAAAAGVSEPNAGNQVESYQPPAATADHDGEATDVHVS